MIYKFQGGGVTNNMDTTINSPGPQVDNTRTNIPKNPPTLNNIPVYGESGIDADVREFFESDYIPRFIKMHPERANVVKNAFTDLSNNLKMYFASLPSSIGGTTATDKELAYTKPDSSEYYNKNNPKIFLNINDEWGLRPTVQAHELAHAIRQGFNTLKENSVFSNYIIDWYFNTGYSQDEINLLKNLGITNLDNGFDKDIESGATNTEFRFKIWKELKTKLGRTPTLEEMDNYIDNYNFNDLSNEFIRENGYSESAENLKELPFKETLKTVAQNTSQLNINNTQIARKGGIMSYRKGKKTYNPYTDTTTNPDNDPYVSEYFEYDVLPRYQREHPNATELELNAIRETYGKYPSVYDSKLGGDRLGSTRAGSTLYAWGIPIGAHTQNISYNSENPLRQIVVHENTHGMRQDGLGEMLPGDQFVGPQSVNNAVSGIPPIGGRVYHSGYNAIEANYLENAYGLKDFDFPNIPFSLGTSDKYYETTEAGATNTELRYVLWRELYTKLGRRPTLEEMDNYISNYRDSDLMGKLRNENAYGEHSAKEQPVAAPVKQALIHVADNDEMPDTTELARHGGIIGRSYNTKLGHTLRTTWYGKEMNYKFKNGGIIRLQKGKKVFGIFANMADEAAAKAASKGISKASGVSTKRPRIMVPKRTDSRIGAVKETPLSTLNAEKRAAIQAKQAEDMRQLQIQQNQLDLERQLERLWTEQGINTPAAIRKGMMRAIEINPTTSTPPPEGQFMQNYRTGYRNGQPIMFMGETLKDWMHAAGDYYKFGPHSQILQISKPFQAASEYYDRVGDVIDTRPLTTRDPANSAPDMSMAMLRDGMGRLRDWWFKEPTPAPKTRELLPEIPKVKPIENIATTPTVADIMKTKRPATTITPDAERFRRISFIGDDGKIYDDWSDSNIRQPRRDFEEMFRRTYGYQGDLLDPLKDRRGGKI